MITKLTDLIKNYIHKKNNVFPLTLNRDGFLFFLGDNGNVEQLIIDPKKISQTINYINQKNIKSVTINDTYFVKHKNLDFILDIPNIEQINVLQSDLNLKPIEKLSDIKSLSFNKTTEKLNLERLENLENLSCDYRSIVNLENCKNLKSVNIDFFNQDNLMVFQNNQKLENIFLYRTNIKNFIGIDNLENINKIELHNAPKLESLFGLPKNSKKLETLFIYNAKNLTNYENLRTLLNIKKLQLVSGGEIDNLEIFKKMDNLEFLQLGVKIKNGNKTELMDKINKK